MTDNLLLFPVLSNIAYLPTFLYLLNARQYFDAVNMICVFIFSTMYHMCDMGYCAMEYASHQFLDYVFAYLTVSLLVIYFMDLKSEKLRAGFKMVAVGVTLFLSVLDRSNKVNYIIFDVIIACFGFYHLFINILKYMSKFKKCSRIFDHKLCKFVFSNRKYDFHPVRLIFFFIGLVIFTVALVVFTVIQTDYWLFHSIWHILGAIALIFLYLLYDNSSLMGKCCFIKKKRKLVSVKKLFDV